MAYRRTGLSSQAFLRPSAHAMTRSWASNLHHDAVGGLVSSAIAIPLAVGFGMFAFVTLGDEYFAYGALAGLPIP